MKANNWWNYSPSCADLEGLNGFVKDIPSDLWSEFYDKTIGVLNANPAKYSTHYKNVIIHLVDSTERGYTTMDEVYDVIQAKELPNWIYERRSAYQHLIK